MVQKEEDNNWKAIVKVVINCTKDDGLDYGVLALYLGVGDTYEVFQITILLKLHDNFFVQ